MSCSLCGKPGFYRVRDVEFCHGHRAAAVAASKAQGLDKEACRAAASGHGGNRPKSGRHRSMRRFLSKGGYQ